MALLEFDLAPHLGSDRRMLGNKSRPPRRDSRPGPRIRAARAVRHALVAALGFAATSSLSAQAVRPDELAEMTLEQLADVQLVSVSSKRPQKAAEAPSVVTVVTADEIRRHAYRTLGDILRSLPGFYVSNDRNYSYVGVRGFGTPGDYNSRMLVLVDGVRTNDNIYDGAYVGYESPIDVDLIERLEISRGPGAAVYGNNAFFGVVNIITRDGTSSPGGALAATVSSFGTLEGRARFGQQLAGGGSFLVAASLVDRDGQTLFFPEFADQGGGTVAGGDGERAQKAFASFGKGGFRFEALHSSRRKHIPTASYGTTFGDTRAMTTDAFTVASLAYERSLGARVDWTARLNRISYDYDGVYPYEGDSNEILLAGDSARGRWWGAESTGTLRVGSHTLLLGAEFALNSRQDQSGDSGTPETAFEIPDDGTRYGVFLQDDLSLGSRVRVSLGARYDHHEDYGGTAHPRVALILTPGWRTTVKLLYGASYRAPNEYEQNFYPAQETAEGLSPETIRTAEAVLERNLGEHVRLVASLFANDIRELITLESDGDGELVFRNTTRARSRGGELALTARLPSGLQGSASYSYQRAQGDESRPLPNSPNHMAKASLAVPFLGEKAWASFGAHYLSARRTLAGGETAGFVRVDATLLATKLALGRGLEASVSVYNLFDTRYSDPGSVEHRQDAIPQDGRSLALSLGWRF